MAEYTVHYKKATDDVFLAMLPIIEQEAWDERNFVRKAVNWALRQIGKRNSLLRNAAIHCAERILAQDTKAAKWIAKDAIKELQGK
jgi:3-methyladenine DNA glycosylase AlkD